MEAIQRIAAITFPLLRLLLGGLFVYTGAAKLMDLSAFQTQIVNFGFDHPGFAFAVSRYLPMVEILCGFALILHRLPLGAWALYVVLLLAFEGGLAFAWWSGYEGSCGCFGKFFGGATVQTALVRNMVLLGVAAGLLLREISMTRKGVVQ